jgi:hypothetical protein
MSTNTSANTRATSKSDSQKPTRNPASVALGWTFALLILAGGVFLSAKILVWFIALLHTWWSFIPTMSYSTSLKITVFVFAVSIVGTVLNVIVRKLIGVSTN